MLAIARDLAIPIALTVLLYLGGLLVPRPMIALRTSDPAELLVDFHSHTSRSHDGRWDFDAESNRAWHSASGFDAAYITEHQKVETWQSLAEGNERAPAPRRLLAGAFIANDDDPRRTILLPGIETVVPGAHLTLLGVRAEDAPIFRHARNLDTLGFAALNPANRPLVLLTLPFDLSRAPTRSTIIDAIEWTDGAPRGLGFARTNRARIEAIAESLHVPLVASSNNHGWGATAVAWTVVRLEGWRAMSPPQLDARLRQTIRSDPAAVRVAARTPVPAFDDGPLRYLLIPQLALHIVRIASLPERVAFIAWAWGVCLVLGLRVKGAAGRVRSS